MYSVINFIISFGALQGLVIGIFLLIKSFKSNRKNIYLSLILIGFAAILGRVLILTIYKNESSFCILLNFILLISPSLYLYSKKSLKSSKKNTFNSIHFFPFLLINLGYLLFYFLLKNSINYQEYLQNIIKINESFSLAFFVIYLILTYNFFKQHTSSYSKTHYKLLVELTFIYIFFLIIWILYVALEWMYFQYDMELKYYYPIMILIAIILYYLSLKVLIQIQFLFNNKEITSRKNVVLDASESKLLLNQLTLIMSEKKPFLEGNLSLTTLAKLMNVNPKALSFVLNEHIHKNFNDYINAWRIEEVKKRLSDKKYNHYKMLSIAFDCGFNSKSTFNLAFKKATGLSPSKYKSTLKS